jgi:hypothetical protein
VFDHLPKYHLKILLGYFTEKFGTVDHSKLKIGRGSLLQDSNFNGVVAVKFATSVFFFVKSSL